MEPQFKKKTETTIFFDRDLTELTRVVNEFIADKNIVSVQYEINNDVVYSFIVFDRYILK